MREKGFLFAILTFFLLMSIFLLASYFYLHRVSTTVESQRMVNVFDDVRSDIENILQLEISVNLSSNEVTFSDHIPIENGSGIMTRYEDFLENTYASELNINITLSNITNSLFVVQPVGLIYGYDDFDKQKIMVYNASGDAGFISKYNITIDFDENLFNSSNDLSPGSFDIVMNATFANDSYYYSSGISRNDNSTWFFDFGDSNLTLQLGSNEIGGLTRNGTMVALIKGQTEGDVKTILTVQKDEMVGVMSNLYLSVRNKLEREDYIWLTAPAEKKVFVFPTTTTVTTTTSTSTTVTTSTTTTSTTSTSTTTILTCQNSCSNAGYSKWKCRNSCSGAWSYHAADGDADCSPKICCCR